MGHPPHTGAVPGFGGLLLVGPGGSAELPIRAAFGPLCLCQPGILGRGISSVLQGGRGGSRTFSGEGASYWWCLCEIREIENLWGLGLSLR